MSGNTFGTLFAVTNFGESHGPAIGCVIDGCPPGMALAEADIQVELEQFVQVFQTPAHSFGLVSVNVRLSGASTDEASFSEQVAATTPDAAGGVRALAEATNKLIARIVDWATGAHGKTAARPSVSAGMV